MDPRRFDAFTRALSGEGRTATRRRLLTALPALAAAALAPPLVRAFDAGVVQVPLGPGQIACSGAADCPANQVCINGVCGLLGAVGGRGDAPAAAGGTTPSPSQAPTAAPAPGITPTPAPTGDAGVPTPTPRAVAAPDTDETPTAPDATATPTDETPVAIIEAGAEATPRPAVGGGAIVDEPLPAAIFRGTCGSLDADPAFPLIEIGTEQAIAAPDLPDGAPDVEGDDFSSTIVSTTLDGLLAEPHAIDIRLVADDPTTSVACGNITGTPTTAEENEELVVPLDEQDDSGASGVAFIREEEGERSLVYAFVSRPDAASASAQAAGTPGAAAGTPVAANGFRRGDTVVTLADINLRAAPSTAAAIVEVLGTGVELDVTVNERDGWVPVAVADGGARGFVAAENVELAS